MTQRHKLSKCYWENDANRLAPHRVATNLQFKQTNKKAVSVKHNKAKHTYKKYGMPILEFSFV